MFSIAGALLGGWILSLFGFDGVVIEGMAQLFGVAINKTGYYFMFGIAGMLGNIASRFSQGATLDMSDWNKKNNKKIKRALYI